MEAVSKRLLLKILAKQGIIAKSEAKLRGIPGT
jgi:hypothetical protein